MEYLASELVTLQGEEAQAYYFELINE